LAVGEVPAPLVLANIEKTWPRHHAPVLADVNLTLGAGTLTWLAGANGAGKTTLIRIVGGILAPDAGTVTVLGYDAEREPRHAKRRIGFLAAGSSGLYARLTVRQQLEYAARLAMVARGERGELVGAAVADFGLEHLAERRQDRISMGERQRVRLAMAFVHRPRVVLLDEPRNSLDGPGMDTLTAAVSRAREGGAAVLWCSPTGDRPAHDPDHAYRVEHARVVVA
jgi:ABC-type multidrug transport system ATPase subunit